MLQNILNLEGVTVLGKKQLKSINGGQQSCSFILTNLDDTIEVVTIDNMPDGQSGSDLANGACVDIVITQGNGVGRFQYDCTWDN